MTSLKTRFILMLALVLGLAFGFPRIVSADYESTTAYSYNSGDGYLQVEWVSVATSTADTLEITLERVPLNWNVDFYATTNVDSITTTNLQYMRFNGTVMQTEVLTAGTAKTSLKSHYFKAEWTPPSASPWI